ncbi:FkbM family methyltransferase [Flavobacterium sp. TAB 87]|uniref:FkbM family methyltransferase n=1 Tax=Flavobacterium sp. TAB 87 TaxID=1729581 RepID=UPI001E460F49|nr:FkbM family methyltransferase [Flavobacterium sp. TAB 87]
MKSFSQEGEDLILERLFEGKNWGIYVDVGAHHPYRYSNTFKFYLKGWRGVNIDAMPGSMDLFNKWRPRDFNIEAAISEEKEILCFYIFNDLALNTFDETVVKLYDNDKYFRVIEKKEIETKKLSDVLENSLRNSEQIDFMSIDVEGLDLDVLHSNDWQRFKPLVILIEILNVASIIDVQDHEIYIYLTSKGYKLFSRTVNTFIFKL